MASRIVLAALTTCKGLRRISGSCQKGYEMEPVKKTQQTASSDRRDSDRRMEQVAFDGSDRREGERRSGKDRRKIARA